MFFINVSNALRISSKIKHSQISNGQLYNLNSKDAMVLAFSSLRDAKRTVTMQVLKTSEDGLEDRSISVFFCDMPLPAYAVKI